MDDIIAEKFLIFSTGVFLVPVLCIINGKEQYRWVATSFEESTYYDGEVIYPVEYADDLKDMIRDD